MVGQEHLSAPNAPLRILCEKGELGHSFFYGPPGSGKTTIARIIADVMQLPFYEFNATSLKIEQLRKIFEQYKNSLQRPLIFIDEVHRLAKNQQEVLLPVMENNTMLVLGASTENPYFSLTAAMRSRSLLFELKAINAKALAKLLALTSKEFSLDIQDDAKEYLIHGSGGDARAMLKLLEFASNISLHPKSTSSSVTAHVNLELLKQLRPTALNDGSSEATVHYDLASAMIKSVRGSDADAAVYYLARLIEGGEPPEFIARRLVILASEDIGNANPQALTLATSCMTAVSKIGYPEARIILSQTIIYLSGSPKSNSAYVAINEAQKAIENGEILEIPKTIQQWNKDYKYPHDYGGWVEQKYLSKPLKFVNLKDIAYEGKMKKWFSQLGNNLSAQL